MLKPFLTANWRYLAMLNFAVDPKILAPHVPVGTQLDFHHDKPASASSASSSITRLSAASPSHGIGTSKK
jgi:uncharacterized protein YqjF (DUF2071 family)